MIDSNPASSVMKSMTRPRNPPNRSPARGGVTASGGSALDSERIVSSEWIFRDALGRDECSEPSSASSAARAKLAQSPST
ncbi:hypothetical protein GCM10010198_12750 [Nocardia seriolae]|nr:hypothetical protein NSERKGN1266_12730 [Nocardia seriolae]BEK98840.1 hypothetical protein NSER024013_67460 [Nocardia seriolae]GEM28555.1 hypothetical protein NS2_67940 [Nocardia seriolae NBRC 15557]